MKKIFRKVINPRNQNAKSNFKPSTKSINHQKMKIHKKLQVKNNLNKLNQTSKNNKTKLKRKLYNNH